MGVTGESSTPRRWPRLLGLLGAWLVIALPLVAGLFLTTSTQAVVAGHDAQVRPTLERRLVVEMGPYLPDLRMPLESPVGVRLTLGKTAASSYEEIGTRYAALAARPETEVSHLRDVIVDQAVAAAVRGGLLAAIPVGFWILLGPQRRAELLAPEPRRLVAIGLGVIVVGTLVVAPWRSTDEPVAAAEWVPLGSIVPEVELPAQARTVEIQQGLLTRGTRTLVASGFDTYDRSVSFYSAAVETARELEPRQPEEGERVAVMVTDRHDNTGMDPVVAAVAERAGATIAISAGDDTSTGESWERFSLDSLDQAFADYDDRIFVTGNHDEGEFVPEHLSGLGWRNLNGEQVEVDGIRIYGANDPRSSGLGTWRNETNLSFGEVEQRVADDVCALDEDGERPQLLLVHDANLGRTALDRGCADLVVGGHVHTRSGPDPVTGENGRVGYTYTAGTTGGAAYAIAVGSKLRRPAEFTFLTFAEDGTPAGLQWVVVETNGRMSLSDYVELDLPGEETDAAPVDAG